MQNRQQNRHPETVLSVGDPGWIRTSDPQLRRLSDRKDDQTDSCKTDASGSQSHQGVTGETQNATAFLLSPAASLFYDKINAAPSPDQLDNLGREVWHHWGKGEFADDEATFLNSAIDKRRPLGRRHSNVPGIVTMKAVGKLQSRLGSRFTPRQRPRSPNRQASRDRRRRLGGSSALPDTLRHHYTEGQRAVLCILAGEIKHHGICDLPVDKIAALAGVCRTTVQTTVHEARRLGHIAVTERPVPGRKSLTNVIEISSREWRVWIKRGPTAHRPIGSKSVNLVSTTKNTDRKKRGAVHFERPQEAIRGSPRKERMGSAA